MSTKNMASDYLWIRNAPLDQATTFKNHGNVYLYDRAPNRIERLEMMYRSIGKTYDW
jgi:tricorn protease-like protein